MIPAFPTFKRLTLQDKAEFERLTRGLDHYTEYSFTTTFAWNVLNTLYVSTLNNNLVIRFYDSDDKKHYFSLIGLNQVEASLEQLLDHVEQSRHGQELRFIAHEIAEHFKEDEYLEIVEDRDNHDYIISLKEFIELKGGSLANKRHKINHFKSHYGEVSTFNKLDLHNPVVLRSIRAVVEKWRPPKDQYAPIELIMEFSALERMLRYHKTFDTVEVFGLYINGDLEAFTAIQKINATMAVGQFEKANKTFTGIFEYLSHQTMLQLHNEGFTHINIQQDLGYPGLRKSKLAYGPVTFQKKYTISRKPLAARSNQAKQLVAVQS